MEQKQKIISVEDSLLCWPTHKVSGRLLMNRVHSNVLNRYCRNAGKNMAKMLDAELLTCQAANYHSEYASHCCKAKPPTPIATLGANTHPLPTAFVSSLIAKKYNTKITQLTWVCQSANKQRVNPV